MAQDLLRRVAAEFFGTFWLVFGGCGAALLSTASLSGIGILGVATAFGLSVLCMAYTFGRMSGGHFNPAVTLGLWSARRCDTRDLIPYWAAQLGGGAFAAALLYMIVSARPDADLGSFAANGYGELSPHHFSLIACFVTEAVTTFFFVWIILGVTSEGASAETAGLVIGLALMLVHLIAIPITNASVNPARSTATAIFAGNAYLAQLWLFWLAPMTGAVSAGVLGRWYYDGARPYDAERSARGARPLKQRGAPA